MNKIIIAASVLGTAAAGIFWYMKNRQRADAAIDDMKQAARNTYNRVKERAAEASHKADRKVRESLA